MNNENTSFTFILKRNRQYIEWSHTSEVLLTLDLGEQVLNGLKNIYTYIKYKK